MTTGQTRHAREREHNGAGDLVLRFLESIAGRREAAFYLSLFRAERPEQFALIHVARPVLQEALGVLLSDVAFLAKLGLTPVLCFGVQSPARARADAEAVAARLGAEVPCAVVSPDGAAAECQSGRIPLVPIGSAAAECQSGRIPLVPIGSIDNSKNSYSDQSDRSIDSAGNKTGQNDRILFTETDDATRAARFDALAALASRLGTRKLVWLGRAAGLDPRGLPRPSLVDVTSEREALSSRLPPGQASLLDHIDQILGAGPAGLTVAVTSPFDLLRELFTLRGAGTLIRRGSVVTRHATYPADADTALRALMESAFGRTLAPDFFARPITAVYIAGDARGAAVVSPSPCGPYLSKFAVDLRAQGDGVGRDLWRALVRDCKTLFWRSRADNPITPWYEQNAHGLVRGKPWCVLWRGLAPEDIPAAIAYAHAAPADFSDSTPPARSPA